jgi:hypothetical protein
VHSFILCLLTLMTYVFLYQISMWPHPIIIIPHLIWILN